MNLKNILLGFAMSGYFSIAGCSSLQAPSGNIELMNGRESSTLDTQLFVPLPKKTSIFVRNRSSLDYEGNSSQFTLADFGYNLSDEVGVFYETQFLPNKKPEHLVGTSYFSKINEDISFLVAPVIGLKSDPELTLQLRMKYTKPISEELSLFSQLETFNNFTMKNHQFSIERLRLGLEKNDYAGGFAVDFEQTGNKFDHTYNIGVFLQKEF